MTDDELMGRFVATFVRLDATTYHHESPPLPEFSAGIDPEDWNCLRWQPAKIKTPSNALVAIHTRTGGNLPRLYEQLALAYRWPQVDLEICHLLENLPAADLRPLADSMFKDPVLNRTLLPAGFARFAIASEDYDPICFDLNRFTGDDCPVVRFNHETILTHDELGDAQQLFASFRDLMLAVVAIENRR